MIVSDWNKFDESVIRYTQKNGQKKEAVKIQEKRDKEKYTKKKIAESWPKINAFIEKKPDTPDENKKPSFFRKAILESEAKIRRIKEKVKKEHE